MAIPATQMPEKYAREYFRGMRRMVQADARVVRKAFVEEIQPKIHAYREELRRISANQASTAAHLRANDALSDIQRVVERLRQNADYLIFAGPAIERLVRRFVEQTNRHIRFGFRAQVAAVLGFDPTASEPWLRSFLDTAVHENVSWIKSIGVEYHNKIESIILQGVRRGESINVIASRIAEAGKVSLKRARFIARDQIGSLHGDLRKARAMRLGLKKFIWSTARDERVRGNPAGLYPDARPSHWALHGKTFEWATGAEVDGVRLWPGSDFACRCVDLIVEEDLLEVAER